MKISSGLFDHMVLQRDQHNVSQARFSGQTSANGAVRARVWKRGKLLRDFDGVKVGKAAGGTFSGRLAGLPAGGPYRIELRVAITSLRGVVAELAGKPAECVMVSDVLVGDVWILAGQSNMQGIGLLRDAEKPDPEVRAFYMTDEWRVARDPLHNLWEAIDPVHASARGPAPKFIGVGPGLAFGKAMRKYARVPQGLLACAHGGTSMSQWDPKLKDKGGESLYGATLRRFQKNGGRVAGIVWYQGESDANPDAARLYMERMKELVGSFRKDLGDRKLPFVLVQIASFFCAQNDAACWNSIQEQERLLPRNIPNCATVPAIDLALDDLIHIGGKDNGRLGRRLAQAMWYLQHGPKAAPPPIELKRVKLEKNREDRGADIVIEYDNVVGALRAEGRPNGFSLSDRTTASFVHRVLLEGKRVRLRTSLSPNESSARMLHYGFGFAPYCNIVDAADRSLPVFGPHPLGKVRLLTPLVHSLRESELLPSAGKLHELQYPADKAALGLKFVNHSGTFCDRHSELGPRAPEDLLVYFACEIDLPEPMELLIWLGYDGPTKLWIDGKEKFFDPDGINPANINDAKIPFDAAAGKHEILVALGSNSGKAWGIFLQFERMDISAREIKKNPARFALPTVLG